MQEKLLDHKCQGPHELHETILFYTEDEKENEKENEKWCGHCAKLIPLNLTVGNICPSCQHRFNEQRKADSQ